MAGSEKTSPQVQALTEEQGLQRAAKRFPDIVAAAATKAMAPLTTKPIPPLTIPALTFRPLQGKDGAR